MRDDHTNGSHSADFATAGGVTYVNEERDAIAAIRLNKWAMQFRLWNWRSMVAIGVMLPILSFVLNGPNLILPGALGGLGGLVVVLAFARLLDWLLMPAVGRRRFRQQQLLHGECRATWGTDGLRMRTSYIDTRLPWAFCRRWRENARVVLLYQSDGLFQFIPKRALSQDQAASLRACAADAGVLGA